MKNSKFSKCFKSIFSVLLALGLSTISACVGGGYRDLSLPKNELILDEFEEYDDDLVYEYATATSNELRASTSSSDSILLGEVFNSSTKVFNLRDILYALTGRTISSLSDLADYLKEQGGSLNASDFRQVEVSSNRLTKGAGQDVRVTMGGLTWYAMYLSLTDYDDVNFEEDNPVLTLWLDNYAQTPETFASSEDDFTDYGFAVIDGFEYWLPDLGHFNSDAEYSSSDSITVSDMTSWNGRRSAVYFHLPYLFLIDSSPRYVSPRETSFQKNESAKEILGLPYNLPNEAWNNSLSDDGFYSSKYNYGGRWASSLTGALYLPSLSEIGYSGVSGLWGASPAQRACNATATGQIYGYNIANNTLTRSGNYKQTYGYYFVKSSGEGKGIGATYARVVRPCINIDLGQIAQWNEDVA